MKSRQRLSKSGQIHVRQEKNERERTSISGIAPQHRTEVRWVMSMKQSDTPLIHAQKDIPGHRMCMLIITHACNLNCAYCYESHKSSRQMSLPLAQSIISKEIALVEASETFERLEVHLIGGEPFMNYPLIRGVVEWLSELTLAVPVIVSCSTNGTLINAANKDWLCKHRDLFHVVLSYDGDSQMQRHIRTFLSKPAIDFDDFLRI